VSRIEVPGNIPHPPHQTAQTRHAIRNARKPLMKPRPQRDIRLHWRISANRLSSDQTVAEAACPISRLSQLRIY
jgi:hypothetical protein